MLDGGVGEWVSDIYQITWPLSLFSVVEKKNSNGDIQKIFQPCYSLNKIIKLSNMLKKIFKLHWKYQAPPPPPLKVNWSLPKQSFSFDLYGIHYKTIKSHTTRQKMWILHGVQAPSKSSPKTKQRYFAVSWAANLYNLWRHVDHVITTAQIKTSRRKVTALCA